MWQGKGLLYKVAASLVGLFERKNKAPWSGGRRERIALGMAVVSDDATTGKVYVLVKPGINRLGRGACPICQNVCMQVMLKLEHAESKPVNVEIVSLDPNTKHRSGCSITKLPMLIHNEFALSSVDDITEYLDDLVPEGPRLGLFDSEANRAQANIFSRFCYFMKNNSPPDALYAELSKLNVFLLHRRSKFLVGDAMTAMDCSLVPKLHHIRVVGYTIKGLLIPRHLTALWNYIQSAYEQHCFRITCPSDQDIIAHWIKDSTVITEMMLLKPTYTLSSVNAGDDEVVEEQEENDALCASTDQVI